MVGRRGVCSWSGYCQKKRNKLLLVNQYTVTIDDIHVVVSKGLYMRSHAELLCLP